jgi:hypothetical protein
MTTSFSGGRSRSNRREPPTMGKPCIHFPYGPELFGNGDKIMFFLSHFWDRPVPIFSDARFSYLALVQDKQNHVRFTGKCMLYSLCQLPPPPQFSMLFLFKINTSLYISFQSFINTQILTISHIIIYYIITFTQFTKIWNCFFDWHEGKITRIVYMKFTNKHETKNSW